MFLRYILLSVLIVVVLCKFDTSVLPQNFREKVRKLHGICSEKHGVSDAEIQKADIDSSENLRCYIHCLMESQHWIGKDGGLNWDTLDQDTYDIIKTTFSSLYDKCKIIEVGTGKCELAYNFAKCFRETDPKNFFVP